MSAQPQQQQQAPRLPIPGQLYSQDPFADPTAYHTRGGIETMDYLRAKLDQKGFEAFLIGKIHQKLHRAYTKTGTESRDDYFKASWYLGRLMRHMTQSVGGSNPDQLDALSQLNLGPRQERAQPAVQQRVDERRQGQQFGPFPGDGAGAATPRTGL